jgi:hypothetical protein
MIHHRLKTDEGGRRSPVEQVCMMFSDSCTQLGHARAITTVEHEANPVGMLLAASAGERNNAKS